MLGMIDAGLRDSTLSVQIAAAWALANLADVITQRPMPDAVQCSSIADGEKSSYQPQDTSASLA